jgi:hypothetical protein
MAEKNFPEPNVFEKYELTVDYIEHNIELIEQFFKNKSICPPEVPTFFVAKVQSNDFS